MWVVVSLKAAGKYPLKDCVGVCVGIDLNMSTQLYLFIQICVDHSSDTAGQSECGLCF